MKTNKTSQCCAANRKNITLNKSNNTDINKFNMSINANINDENDMILLKGGEFLMGTNDVEGFSEDNEGPVRKASVNAFYIDKTTVTNEQFGQFINETGYKTDAEKFGWSFVFHMFLTKDQLIESKQLTTTPWWFAVEQAYWYQPFGKHSNIDLLLDHPVVHVSWNDAKAYCKWANKRLPNETEWEYAARGGKIQKKYPWGDELTPNGEHQCNIWQGDFPNTNTKKDGYIGTAPSKSYPTNGYGLYNMSGNVWEWCENSFDELEGYEKSKAIRGGSYLCHYSYCNRYRVAARSLNTADSSSGNMGFRCVKDI